LRAAAFLQVSEDQYKLLRKANSMKTLRNLLLAGGCVAAACPVSPAIAGTVGVANTPIQHVIIVVGENHTFDNLFGVYQPKTGQRIKNLWSQGIVNVDGTPGPNFSKGAQYAADVTKAYAAKTGRTTPYTSLPQPWTTWEVAGPPPGEPDPRFPTNLPNGPYQISKYAPYNQYTGDPVHRFFQMWQEVNGGKNDKFVFVEESVGTGPQNSAPAPTAANAYEGAISMGFYNMSTGDASTFKSLADSYAISDNYHQAIMGGTGANFMALVTGDAAFFTNPDGTPGTPYSNQIENPNPQKGTDNFYTRDGYAGGSYVDCADPKQPGVGSIKAILAPLSVPANCQSGHYYLVNNYNPYWDQFGNPRTIGSDKFVLPAQTIPNIADKLASSGVTWKYYTADRPADSSYPVPFHFYCGICDPLTSFSSVMTTGLKNNLQAYADFVNDVQNNTLPSVAYVRPFEALAGHPADSTADLYEMFVTNLIATVKASPEWASTAIIITTDEGGGYYDSGYVQPVDFFGDGTRIPLIVVSPYSKVGYVDHTYSDHASVLKFIESNWNLTPLSSRSRDNLPNPVQIGNSYAPTNGPSIGDLMTLFDFTQAPHG
jgi:phospholipase C